MAAGKNAAGLKNRGEVENGRYSAFETKQRKRRKGWLSIRLKGWNFVKELAWISHSRLADETERMSDWIFWRWKDEEDEKFTPGGWTGEKGRQREEEKRESDLPRHDWLRFSLSIFNLLHLHIEISVLILPSRAVRHSACVCISLRANVRNTVIRTYETISRRTS